ncbi:MAG: carbon starvation protein A, partial [Gammaproteobacteria bacterium]|nr:carbon starvation protein A [Gammaproteobacteria bacterium]
MTWVVIASAAVQRKASLARCICVIAAICIIAIAYRYYSAFLAARVACLNDGNITPAHRLEDGQNYHPTSRMVLFGHH